MEYFEFEMFVGNSQSEMHRTFITTYPLGKRWPACDSDFRFPGVLATRAIGLQKLFDYNYANVETLALQTRYGG